MAGNESQNALSNAGKFWSPGEDKVLCARYDAGASIADLATKHGRTHYAITSRLIKIGKVQASSEMGPRTSPHESTRENVCNKPLSSHQAITQKYPPVHTGGILNAGKFWSHREDKALCARYDAGASIADMAIKHARTEGAITIRLVKLGKVQTGSEMDPKIRPQTRTRTRPPVQPLYTKLPPKLTGPECVDCGKELFVDPSKATTNGFLCTSCSKRRLEMRNNISNKIQPKHKIITRRIDEGIAGSRDDHKKMRRWKLS